MKKWKKYPLLLVLLITGILITGAGYMGDHSIYSAYSRTNGWMTPEASKVFQGWKDGIYPWDLADKRAERVSAPAKGEGGTDGEEMPDGGTQMEGEPSGQQPPEGDGAAQNGQQYPASRDPASQTSISGNQWDGGISGNHASGNSISGNDFSGNGSPGYEADRTVSGNTAGEHEGKTEAGSGVSENGADSSDDADGTFTVSATGEVYDSFGRLVGQKQTDAPSDSAGTEDGQSGTENQEQGGMDGQTGAGGQSAEEEEGALENGLGLGDLAAEELGLGEDEERTWEPGPVEEAYFDDALFIGDSRTVGLSEYGGFQEGTTFYAATSLTIYNLFDSPKKFAQTADGSKVTLEEALSQRKFGKIYLMLGINEMGRGTTESFFKVYADAVNRIRVLQPDAIIFVQGIMRVSGEKSSTDPVFNNVRINERNQALAAMADGKQIFYLEVNDAVCDENGDLITEYTYDQIHLKAKYYKLWKDYLLAHGVVKG